MKTKKINDVDVSIPTSFDEITLKQFVAVQQIKETEQIEQTINLVKILCSIEEEFINNIPYVTLLELSNDLGFLFKTDISNVKDNLDYIIEVDGQRYGFDFEISKYSTAQYIDLDYLVKDKEQVLNNLPQTVACLYRKIIKQDKKDKMKYTLEKYDSETLQERADIFLNQSCKYALSAMFFFAIIEQNLLEDLVISSIQMMHQTMKN